MELLIIIGGLAIVVFVVSTISIYAFLSHRNEPLGPFVLINLFIFGYLERYKRITKQEKGAIGPLYYSWLLSINIALLCAILLIVFKL